MFEEDFLFNLLVPRQFYLAVFILYFDFVYQKLLTKYPFFNKIFSNKTKLQGNDHQKADSSLNSHLVHINTIVKLTKALTILLLSRGLIVTLISPDKDVLERLITGALSLIATVYIAVKCVPRDKLSTILKCSINAKDRLKIVIQSDILLSFTPLILFQLKQYNFTDRIAVLVFINSYIVSIRFLQCVREKNWLNVLKYGFNYPILYCHYHGINNDLLHYLKLAQAIYGGLWDILMDWKLHLGIDSRVLNKKVIFVLALLAVVSKFAFLYKDLFNDIEIIPLMLEINRRLVWVLLRFDYEYYAL